MPKRFSVAVQTLTSGGDLRVWSVIVSIFGDLAQVQGDVITSGLLSQITARMGIKPQALRVALHRLRKDGWIDSLKSGRTSAYHLTASGFQESFAARARIYAPAPVEPIHWTLLVSRPQPQAERMADERRLLTAGYVPLTSGVYLGHKPVSLAGFLIVDCNIKAIPDWIRTKIASEHMVSEIAKLDHTLAIILTLLGNTPEITPLETATLRVLIVHNWRRLLLRLPDLPDRFFPTDWRGAACRDKVQRLLRGLDRPELCDLQVMAPGMARRSA